MSYAHVPPDDAGPRQYDDRVRGFFTDLSSRVARLADADTPLGGGLYDQSFDLGVDWNTALSQALGAAEVLVPLYSARYVAPRSWPMAERGSFERRLRAASRDPSGHIQPVLWMPLAPGDSLPADGVDDVGEGVPHYRDFGLGALSELGRYRATYDEIVDRLAHRIVRVAEDSPIGPSGTHAPADRPASGSTRVDLVIAVLAPTTSALPRGRSAQAYGARPADWTPFVRARPLAVAHAAVAVAERLNLFTAIVDLPEGEETMKRRPSALLIDPWMLAQEGGDQLLERMVRFLPDWTVPIVISDVTDVQHAQHGAELHQQAVAMIRNVPHSLVTIHDPVQFINAIPMAVTQARRRYLKNMPVIAPSRPRLTDPDLRTKPTREATDHG